MNYLPNVKTLHGSLDVARYFKLNDDGLYCPTEAHQREFETLLAGIIADDSGIAVKRLSAHHGNIFVHTVQETLSFAGDYLFVNRFGIFSRYDIKISYWPSHEAYREAI